jgi:hypothetical protein
MAVSFHMYSHFPLTLLTDKLGDLSGETTLKCMLCTSSYTPSQDDHDYKDDVDNEVSGTGYSAGGAIMTTTNPTTAARVTTFDCADTAWSSSTITARYAVIYDYTGGSDGTDALVAYVDFGEDKSSENGTFQLTWNASGLFTITVAA